MNFTPAQIRYSPSPPRSLGSASRRRSVFSSTSYGTARGNKRGSMKKKFALVVLALVALAVILIGTSDLARRRG